MTKNKYCQKCGIDIPNTEFSISKFAKKGYRIFYCSGYCFRKHHHSHHHVPGLLKIIGKLKKINKQYLDTLTMYGYGQS